MWALARSSELVNCLSIFMMNKFEEYESKLHDSLMNQLNDSESNSVSPIHVGKHIINPRELDV